MSTAPRRPDLANEPVGRLMLRLSIFSTITAQLVNMLYNLVDRSSTSATFPTWVRSR